MKVEVISLPNIFQVLYVLCFTRPRFQVSVYRTIGPLVRHSSANYTILCGTVWSKFEHLLDIMHVLNTYKFKMDWVTVMILSFRTNRSGQTVQTQIRLLLEEQSDQGLHFLLFHLHLFDEIPKALASFLEF